MINSATTTTKKVRKHEVISEKTHQDSLGSYERCFPQRSSHSPSVGQKQANLCLMTRTNNFQKNEVCFEGIYYFNLLT